MVAVDSSLSAGWRRRSLTSMLAAGVLSVVVMASTLTQRAPTYAATLPSDAAEYVPNVPSYYQTYPLSCEASSLRMALAKEGITTSDQQILSLTPTDTRAATFTGGAMQWGDPYTSYVGDVSGSEVALTGYGTYYPTIAAVATRLGGRVLRAGEGVSPTDVYGAIQAGHPVVAWVTYQWVAPARTDYVAFDGRSIPFAGPVEHAVTVVGVTPDSVFVNNPITGQEWVSRSAFEAAYRTYNDMAVILD